MYGKKSVMKEVWECESGSSGSRSNIIDGSDIIDGNIGIR